MRTWTEANIVSRTAIVVGSTPRLAARASKAKQAAVDRAVAVRPGPVPPYREQKRTATRKGGKMFGFYPIAEAHGEKQGRHDGADGDGVPLQPRRSRGYRRHNESLETDGWDSARRLRRVIVGHAWIDTVLQAPLHRAACPEGPKEPVFDAPVETNPSSPCTLKQTSFDNSRHLNTVTGFFSTVFP